jgi:hypothetical protein
MARVSAPVVDVPPVPAVFDKTGRAQDHEMLGDGALAEAKHRLHVADALLPVAQDAEDASLAQARKSFACSWWNDSWGGTFNSLNVIVGGGAREPQYRRSYRCNYKRLESKNGEKTRRSLC